MKTKNLFFVALVAILGVSLVGCGGGGLQGSYTKFDKDGTPTEKVTVGIEKKETSKEDSEKGATGSEKTLLSRLSSLEAQIAQVNAEVAALKSLLGNDTGLIEMDKGGEIKLTDRAKQLLTPPAEPKPEPKAEPKPEPKAEKKQTAIFGDF